MDLSRVIIGPVVTEKSERLKATDRTYTLQVAPNATKIEVRQALKTFYDVDATSIRVLRTRPKVRLVGRGTAMEKRHAMKKMLVKLSKDSKTLDLAAFTSR